MKTRAHFNELRWRTIVSLVLYAWASPVFAQHGATEPAAEVLALEQKIEEAIVRGDVTFVDRVTSADFSFVHGDVAITSGRYVSLFVPANRNAANPARLNSIWFERVYAKRNGEWQFLSHRMVHGPNVAPAGIDPTAAQP